LRADTVVYAYSEKEQAMNATRKLLSILSAGVLLATAAPAFADPGRGRDRDYQREHAYYSAHGRGDHRGYQRGWDRQRMVLVERPVRVERPVYYAQPGRVERPQYYAQPARIDDIIIPVAILGAVIGGYIYSQR
jgi:hypothetical protein